MYIAWSRMLSTRAIRLSRAVCTFLDRKAKDSPIVLYSEFEIVKLKWVKNELNNASFNMKFEMAEGRFQLTLDFQ